MKQSNQAQSALSSQSTPNLFAQFCEVCAALIERPDCPPAVYELLNELDGNLFNLAAEANYNQFLAANFRNVGPARLEIIFQAAREKDGEEKTTLALVG